MLSSLSALLSVLLLAAQVQSQQKLIIPPSVDSAWSSQCLTVNPQEFRQTREPFSSERAMEHVNYLAETIGSRPAGSPAATAAAEYISAQLRASDLQVTQQRFIYQEIPGDNVIADDRGSGPVVVIGAHFDTVATTPGANDNASGPAVMMELARITSGMAYPFKLRFIAFDAEELWMQGSRYYLGDLEDNGQLGTQLAMINMDMVGSGGPIGLRGDERLICQATELATELGIPLYDGKMFGGSDHEPFLKAGIAPLSLERQDDRLHTPADVVENITQEQLEESARLVLAQLEQISTDYTAAMNSTLGSTQR